MKNKKQLRTERYGKAAFTVGVGALLHVMAAYSKFFLWRHPDLAARYGLCGEVKGLHPIAWADKRLSDNTESYIYFGTDIVISRVDQESKYTIMTGDGPKTLSEFIDEYPEKTVEPFLFNINLFQ